jgi:hypothetical protein
MINSDCQQQATNSAKALPLSQKRQGNGADLALAVDSQ